MNSLIFIGKGSGKISPLFLKKIIKTKIEGYKNLYFKDFCEFEKFDKFSDFRKNVIIPIYCEDFDLKRTFKIDLAEKIEARCSTRKDCIILHPSEIGRILGNKILTNIFFTRNGVLCPRVISDSSYSGIVFTNELSSSHAKTSVSNCSAKLDFSKYNTEFIDTTFEYKEKKFYACPRAICIQGEINEFYLRFRDAQDNDPNVHGGETPMDYELHNFYYVNYIQPNIDQFKSVCKKIGDLLGLGFYVHDFLLSTIDKKIYLSESAFKFDNIIMWKNRTEIMRKDLCFEKTIEDSMNDSLSIFAKKLLQYN